MLSAVAVFVCPIVGASDLPPWHVVLHGGLAAFVAVSGTILLALGIRAFIRTAPASDPRRGATPGRLRVPRILHGVPRIPHRVRALS
jgi:hypothetical protein